MWCGARRFGGVRGWRARLYVRIVLGLFICGGLVGQALPYFADAEGLTGPELQIRLQQITSSGHVRLSYTPGVWNALMDIYEDPANPDNIILFYSQASIPKTLRDTGSSPGDYWNREHLWPVSRGIGTSTSTFQYCDLFHLVPAYKGVNSARGNKFFDNASVSLPGYVFPAHELAPLCKANTYLWEPADGQKGWTARALFYMATRYAFLSLVDTPPAAELPYDYRMARLSTLLEWNRRFPPGARERFLNQRVYTTYQYNRNPFIDFPEFADAVWLADQPTWGGWRLRHFTLAELLDPAVSGDLADPDGDGLPNLIEMALYSDPRAPDTEPVITRTAGAESVTVRFTRASTLAHLNLLLELQRSSDLETWTAVPLDQATLAPIDAERVSVTVTHSLTGPEPQFFRIRVARP